MPPFPARTEAEASSALTVADAGERERGWRRVVAGRRETRLTRGGGGFLGGFGALLVTEITVVTA